MAKNNKVKQVEYSVYTVCKGDHHNDNHPAWERKHTTPYYRKALARAKVLHRSDDYARVEVKKMVCDAHNVCTVTEGYKVFEKPNAERAHRRMVYGAMGLFVVMVTALLLQLG